MGIDDRDVIVHQKAKSIGHEETFAHDHHSLESLDRQLVRPATGGATAPIRRDGWSDRHHQGPLRRLPHHHPSDDPPSAIDTGPDVIRAAAELLEKIDPTPGCGLLGIDASRADGCVRKLSLDDVEALSWDDATVPSTPSEPATGTTRSCRHRDRAGLDRVKKRGDQQWGPTDRSVL